MVGRWMIRIDCKEPNVSSECSVEVPSGVIHETHYEYTNTSPDAATFAFVSSDPELLNLKQESAVLQPNAGVKIPFTVKIMQTGTHAHALIFVHNTNTGQHQAIGITLTCVQ